VIVSTAVVAILAVVEGFNKLWDFREHVAEAYHAFVPEYEAVIGHDHDPMNADENIGATVQVLANKSPYDLPVKCKWTLDSTIIENDGCEPLDVALSVLRPPLDLDLPSHKMSVEVFDGSGNSLARSLPIEFQVRPIATPHILVLQPTSVPPLLFLGEEGRLRIALPGVANLDDCKWEASAGSIRPDADNSCIADYEAPDLLPRPPDPFTVKVSAALSLPRFANVAVAPVEIEVAAPQENVFQYVLEASSRMKGELFDEARSRIEGDFDRLTQDKGYLGVTALGDAESERCRAHDILPLDAINPEAKGTLEKLRTGPVGDAPVLAGWRESLENYARIKAARKLQNPRYFLTTLVAGADTCDPANPADELAELGVTITRVQMDADWRSHRLLTIALVMNRPAWEAGLRSRGYVEGEAILILADEVWTITQTLEAIPMLGSSDRRAVEQGCRALSDVVRRKGDERGQGRVFQACRAIAAAGR
jgi:hypothetical protein